MVMEPNWGAGVSPKCGSELRIMAKLRIPRMKVPKRIAGFKVPKQIYKSAVLRDLLASKAGREIAGRAVIAGASGAPGTALDRPAWTHSFSPYHASRGS